MNPRFARAAALYQLGEDRQALEDLATVLKKAPQLRDARQYRAMVYARLGQKKEALEDLAIFQSGDATDSTRLCVAMVVAAEIGEGLDRACELMESAIKRAPGDSGLRYDAACAYALASRALARRKSAGGDRYAGQAVSQLEAAIKNGYSDFDHIEEDTDLDPIRDRPGFAELIKAGQTPGRFASVWSADSRFESIAIHGLGSAEELGRCRELAAQGDRPVSLSVARPSGWGVGDGVGLAAPGRQREGQG
jgi:tetratricopeptide (TPR) repeat protein